MSDQDEEAKPTVRLDGKRLEATPAGEVEFEIPGGVATITSANLITGKPLGDDTYLVHDIVCHPSGRDAEGMKWCGHHVNPDGTTAMVLAGVIFDGGETPRDMTAEQWDAVLRRAAGKIAMAAAGIMIQEIAAAGEAIRREDDEDQVDDEELQ